MDSRTTGLTKRDPHAGAITVRKGELVGEITSMRSSLGTLLSELDRRRHELFDWKLQLRKHMLPVAAVGFGALATIGLSVVQMLRHRAQERHLTVKASHLREAVARMIHRPDRVARAGAPEIGNKVLGAIASAVAGAVAGALAKRIASFLFSPATDERIAY